MAFLFRSRDAINAFLEWYWQVFEGIHMASQEKCVIKLRPQTLVLTVRLPQLFQHLERCT